MTESGQKGDSVYLRGWDDYERYQAKVSPLSDISVFGLYGLPHQNSQAL